MLQIVAPEQSDNEIEYKTDVAGDGCPTVFYLDENEADSLEGYDGELDKRISNAISATSGLSPKRISLRLPGTQ